ncbi:MAG: urease accessory protein UreE [Betaproteobacteria bacterium]|nr:urease accessory protein UreE [Betaproteobacteria bacterium]
MIEIRKKLKVKPGAYQIQAKGRLELAFEQRAKSRSKVTLVGGEEVALQLPRGEVLRGGDMLVATDGRVIEVHATPENVLHVACDSAIALTKAAYHLGNRHVPVQVGEGWLRIAADRVLEDMLIGLGAKVIGVQAAFEPESGAYAGDGHAHDSHGGTIHEYGEPADEDGHVHGPDCGHEDGQAHAQDHNHKHDHDHKHDHKHDHGHEHAHGHDHDHKKVIAVVKNHAENHAHDHGHEHSHDHDKAHADDEPSSHDKKHKHH